ncbi:MAG: hypothetical protein IJS47_01845 [Clostridia bacterium]|nr:hypothetical protein [Clostridia bacterium]
MNISYKMMLGVNPGYGHENENLTPESAMKLGSASAIRNFPGEILQRARMYRAAAIYSTDFGCPRGGEVGVQLEGEVSIDKMEELINGVKAMMADLGQTTVTIEWEVVGHSFGSTYICEGGKRAYYNAPTEGIEHFSVKIPEEVVEFRSLGAKLQSAMQEVSRKEVNGHGFYMTSGILIQKVDANGRKYYEYAGTQNPSYGQLDKELYQESVVRTVDTALHEITPSLVEFSEFGVALETYMEREREKEIAYDIERDFEMEEKIEKYSLGLMTKEEFDEYKKGYNKRRNREIEFEM